MEVCLIVSSENEDRTAMSTPIPTLSFASPVITLSFSFLCLILLPMMSDTSIWIFCLIFTFSSKIHPFFLILGFSFSCCRTRLRWSPEFLLPLTFILRFRLTFHWFFSTANLLIFSSSLTLRVFLFTFSGGR